MTEQEATAAEPVSDKENEQAKQAALDRLPKLTTLVWFYETVDGPPLAAIVAGAKDGLLGLAVFEPSGAAVNRVDVPFLTAADLKDKPAWVDSCFCTLPE